MLKSCTVLFIAHLKSYRSALENYNLLKDQVIQKLSEPDRDRKMPAT